LIIHGTGPLTKGRKYFVPHVLELADRGYVAATMSFRHEPKDPFPGAVEDVHAAVRWLRGHARKFHIDGDKIGALGFSGGGTLACLVGMTRPEDGFAGTGGHPKESSRVQAVVAYFAPTDLATLHADCCAGRIPFLASLAFRGSLEQWLGGPPEKMAKRYSQASPLHYVRKDAAPMLILHGTADRQIPLEQSQLFVKKMRAAGASVSLLSFDGAPHDFDELNDTNALLAARATQAFFEKHLRGRTGK
jgi:acetyl esterase/lipase